MSLNIPELHVADYRYILPESRIPDRPLDNRQESKLLCYQHGSLSDTVFSRLPHLLPQSSLVVFNNSKVIPARLHFSTQNGASIEVLCLHPSIKQTFNGQTCEQEWKCIVGNLKRWKEGVGLAMQIGHHQLRVEMIERGGEENKLRFTWDSSILFYDLLEMAGELPLPPYMHRKADQEDKNRYQTVYASTPGSVAAPTAGLHFSTEVLDELKKKGVQTAQLTLHVGAGTFKPIKSETVNAHLMHQEFFEVNRELVEALLTNNLVLAVGTTSMRTLESLYWLGCQLKSGQTELRVSQWGGFEDYDCSANEALLEILLLMEKQNTEVLMASTSMMIVPGYRFRICKGLITNFHQPESTLILLVAAFVGKDWELIYDYALKNDFRFLSYGDSSLLLPTMN